MKTLLLFPFICLTLGVSSNLLLRPQNIWEIVNLTAVTQFEGIQEYYESRRTQYEPDTRPPEAPTSEKRARIKKRICQNILSSHFSVANQQLWLDIDDPQIRTELQQNHTIIFGRIFKLKKTLLKSKFEYTNAYELLTVHLDGVNRNEFLFTCPMRNAATGTIEEYFISREYNVNIAKGKYPMAGRFIFVRNVENQLVLLAIAEESGSKILPWPLSISFIADLLNLTERYNEELFCHNAIRNVEEEDPICQLEVGFKLRLCSILFAASSFKNEISFTPAMENVLPNCQKKLISIVSSRFVTAFLDRFIRPWWGRIFEEWVIGCRAIKRTGETEIYYVSRGSWSNSIFVYTDAGNNNLSTFNYFYNISVSDF